MENPPVSIAASVASSALAWEQTCYTLENDPRWQAVQRVVSSKVFSKSTRVSSFLLYICEKTLRGCVDEITEQQIGVNVFGRPTHYNPGDDNIVRGVARQLRQRLAVYYQEEGACEEVRITVPRGAYIPEFGSASQSQDSESATSNPVRFEPLSVPFVPIDNAPPSRSSFYVLAITMLVLGALIMAAWNSYALHSQTQLKRSSRLWSSLFTPDKRTLIVTGDAGLNMLSNLARREVTLDEYSSGKLFSGPLSQTPKGYTWTPFPNRPYTTFADLSLVSKLVRLPQVVSNQLQVRFARDVRMDDLKNSNVILIGSANYNPWIHLYADSLNFELHWDGEANLFTVTNKAPLAGEQMTYQRFPESNPDHNHGFVLISFINNAFGQNKVLLIQGTTLVGIDAAIDFFSNEGQFTPIIDSASNKDGSLRSFEVLLKTDFVNGNSENTKVIAKRIH